MVGAAAALAAASVDEMLAKSVAAALMMPGVVSRDAMSHQPRQICRWPVSPRAIQSATAMIVRVGLEPLEVANTLPSAT